MKKWSVTIAILILVVSVSMIYAQQPRRDRAVFVEYKNEFLDSIRTTANKFLEKKKEPRKVLKMDFSHIKHPTSVDQFKQMWHNPPISQGLSGMCWCFSTTSFLESEVYRMHQKKVKLSELYTVYWEYVEKARRYVRERGDSEFGEGSEANAVTRIWKKYGIVPEKDYTGLQPGQIFHDHRQMYKEMKNYLKSVKENNEWNEDVVIATIKSIMNHYIGRPPQTIRVDGKTMTPKEYLNNVLQLDPDNYIDFMSLMEKPYWHRVEYEVPDNWWHSKDYYNVPLNVFMNILKRAVRKGYTAAIGGDVSEPGYDSHQEIAVVPTFDIPADYIDENARQFRFSNHSTTDDHGIHVVGYTTMDGKDWYLIKDSGSGSRNGKNPGYYFYHEDYVKLKIMNVMVPKSLVKDILKKFKD